MVYMVTEPLNLIRINIRRAHLDRRREINNQFVVRPGLNHVDHGITNIDGKIHFRAGKALGTVLKHPLRFGVICRYRLD